MGMTRLSPARWAAAALVLLVAGCSGGTPLPDVTITVTGTPGATSATTAGQPATASALATLPPVTTATIAPDELPEGSYTFLMPSKRIGCRMALPGGGAGADAAEPVVRCDLLNGSWTVAAPAAGCDGLGWGGGPGDGRSVGLAGTPGRPKVLCVSDSVISTTAPVLDYGTGVRVGAASCESRTTGVRCIVDGGGAFDLAREALVMACSPDAGGTRLVVATAADPCAVG